MRLFQPSRFAVNSLCVCLTLFVSACGGGSGTGSAPTPSSVQTITNCPDVAPELDVANATLAVCSEAGLKAAIFATSQSQGGNGKVSLPANCSITLTAQIDVTDDLTIDGNGVTIDGNNATQIFRVGRNFMLSRGVNFSLQNATLQNGLASGSGESLSSLGGAISGAQFGNITVLNVKFSNNRSTDTGGEAGGGAIYKAQFGKLTVFNSHFQGNLATNGGAIRALLTSIQLVNSSFAGNTALSGNNGGGAILLDGLQPTNLPLAINLPGGYAPVGYQRDTYGKGRFCGLYFSGNSVGNQYDINGTGKTAGAMGIFVYGPTATDPGGDTMIEIERSMFDGNKAYAGGGALHLGSGGATDFASVKDSVFRNNRAGGVAGGAISLYQKNVNFSNVTIADNCINTGGNTADCSSSSNSDGSGGAIGTWSNQYNLDHVTVVRNRAAAYSGALNQGPTAGALTNSIISANTSGNSYGVAQSCSKPAFTNGTNSYQWQVLARHAADPNDPGCGAATENIDPLVSATPTVCTGRIAGSSFSNAAMVVFLPGQPGMSAGAVCPQ
jgi:hypothetical protein